MNNNSTGVTLALLITAAIVIVTFLSLVITDSIESNRKVPELSKYDLILYFASGRVLDTTVVSYSKIELSDQGSIRLHKEGHSREEIIFSNVEQVKIKKR